MTAKRSVTFTDIDYVLWASVIFLASLSGYGGDGQGIFLEKPCSCGRESRDSAASHTELGGFAVTLKWCEVSCFVRSPTERELKVHCETSPGGSCTGTGNDKFAGTQGHCKGIGFGFLCLGSLRSPPGLSQVSALGSALHAGSPDSIFSSLI